MYDSQSSEMSEMKVYEPQQKEMNRICTLNINSVPHFS